MAAYEVTFKVREEIKDLTATQAEEVYPVVTRVSASSANRAISGLTNELIRTGVINSKSEVLVLEAKVVA